ncbi:MAG: heavy-metal-associated domain-containing protein [Desulfatibacillum sp.]|nr:heavy-metal-associated domain-containing protein [Desulfatibacillum sp.]
MEEKTFSVPKISCGHCVNAIKEELNEMDGVTSVDGDPGTKTIKVQWEAPATEESIRAMLKEINYPAA